MAAASRMPAESTRLFHLLGADDWARAQAAGLYAPASLAGEGFIHLSEARQLRATAARYFSGRDDVVVLAVDERRLAAPVRYEQVRDEQFPHLYGELDLDAVVDVVPLGHATNLVVAAHLARARVCVRGGDSPGVARVPRRDGAPAVALLATFERPGHDLVFPLGDGRNVVGRHRFDGAFEPPVMESAQWIVTCDAGVAHIEDAASTSLSVLFRQPIDSPLDLGQGLDGFRALFLEAGAIPIPHPNEAGAAHPLSLAEGDLVRGCYAAFVFGWCAS